MFGGDCSCLCAMLQKAKEDIRCCALPTLVLFLIPKVSWRLEWPNGHLSLTPTAPGHQHVLSLRVFHEDADPDSGLYMCMVSPLSHWPTHPVTTIWLSILDTLLVSHYCVALNFISLMMSNIDFKSFSDLGKFQISNPTFNLEFEGLALVEFWDLFLYIFNLSSLLHISYMNLKYYVPFHGLSLIIPNPIWPSFSFQLFSWLHH